MSATMLDLDSLPSFVPGRIAATCGPTAIANAAALLGRSITREEAREACGGVAQQASLQSIAAAASVHVGGRLILPRREHALEAGCAGAIIITSDRLDRVKAAGEWEPWAATIVDAEHAVDVAAGFVPAVRDPGRESHAMTLLPFGGGAGDHTLDLVCPALGHGRMKLSRLQGHLDERTVTGGVDLARQSAWASISIFARRLGVDDAEAMLDGASIERIAEVDAAFAAVWARVSAGAYSFPQAARRDLEALLATPADDRAQWRIRPLADLGAPDAARVTGCPIITITAPA